MPQCTWFLGREALGTSPVPATAESQAFYCEQCGDIWARAIVSGAMRHLLTLRSCPNHTSVSAVDWGCVPGSLTSWRLAAVSPAWDTAHCLEYLPRGVLKREFETLIHHLDRSISHDQQESIPAVSPESPAHS